MNVPFLALTVHYSQIEAELKPVLENIMARGALIDGPDFEAEYAAFPSTLSALSGQTTVAACRSILPPRK